MGLISRVSSRTYRLHVYIEMFETPNYNHYFKNQEYRQNVYEPSEDTFILLDAIETEIKSKNFPENCSLCLEIGTGNGIPAAFLAKHTSGTHILMTDINPFSIAC